MSEDKPLTYNEAVVFSSGSFTAGYLPDNWHEWDEEKLFNWLDDNAWEPLEYWPPQDVWDLIDAEALALVKFANGE